MPPDDSLADLPPLPSGLASPPPGPARASWDPEAARARAAIEARLLGVPLESTRIGRFVVLDRLGAGGMGVVHAAFDPELDRKVAIKVLFGRRGDADERARVVREARAMARLAHPNVVHVYEVGEHEGRVFVAMEYVRGQTLRAWWSAQPRTWRATLAVCVQAGQGLAAAHARGIIHRDFKPDNVIVGDDGRARVLDFGLAHWIDADVVGPTLSDARGTEGKSNPTVSQPTAGTPAYMPPEQLRGAPADARGDQFAFCASTWEALTGALPFGPERIAAVALGDDDAGPTPPPRDAMPRWIEVVLRRGLATRDRFASMEALLEALSRDPTRVWTRRLAATAIVTGMVAAFGIGSLSGADRSVAAPPQDPCSGGAALLESAWPSAQRDAAFSRVAALGGAYGAIAAPRTRERVEAYGERWIAAHRDACLAHHRGEQSDELLDRRMACLHRGSSALRTFGEVANDAEVEEMGDLALVASGLPDPDRCGDLTALTAGLAPPPASAGPIGERLATSAVLRHANQLDAAKDELDRVIDDARALEYGPLLAEALLARGLLLIDRKDRPAAVAPLREAVDVALASGADELAVEAWGQLEWVVATGPAALRERPLEGRALILQLAERHPLGYGTMSLYNNLAGVEPYARDNAAARAVLQRAIDIARHLGPSADRTLASALGNLAPLLDDPADRERAYAEAVARWAEVAGPEHPRTLRARGIQAIAMADLDASIAALTEICAQLEQLHAGATHSASNCEHQLALAHELRGDDEACAEATRRWVALAPATEQEIARGSAAVRFGDATEAVVILEGLIARYNASPKRMHWEDEALGEAELMLARAWRRLGRDGADALLQRALDRLDGDPGRVPQPITQRYVMLARALLDRTLPSAPGG